MTKPRHLTNLFEACRGRRLRRRATHIHYTFTSQQRRLRGAGDQHARPKAKNLRIIQLPVRQECWPGVGRLALGTWLVRAWVLTRMIVRVCQPCVPPLSLKRSPELFLPVRVRVGPRHCNEGSDSHAFQPRSLHYTG
jgi:hypothetical protein